MKKEDKRISKSKKAIKNALLELLQTKDINEITIQELAIKADVDRKTIYNNYQNIYEIIDEFSDDLSSSFDNILSSLEDETIFNDPSIVLKSLNKTIESNLSLYLVISKIKNSTYLKEKLYEKIRNRVSEAFKKNNFKNDKNYEFLIEFLTSGMVNAYQSWLLKDDKNKPSLEEFSEKIALMVFNGINGLRK